MRARLAASSLLACTRAATVTAGAGNLRDLNDFVSFDHHLRVGAAAPP